MLIYWLLMLILQLASPNQWSAMQIYEKLPSWASGRWGIYLQFAIIQNGTPGAQSVSGYVFVVPVAVS